MSADAWTARVVGVVKSGARTDGWSETVLAAMCEPQIAIVSLTITEKGYFHSPATGSYRSITLWSLPTCKIPTSRKQQQE
ncbi:hypothetical protein ACLK1S_09705 [Escherichia coli]